MLHIGIIEHRGMYDTVAWQMIVSRTAHLPVANHHVIMRRTCCLNAQFSKHEQQHVYEPVECQSYVFLFRHIREHHIILVCIHAASPTLPAVHLDTMLFAVIKVYLVFSHLMTPEYDTGLYLPHKKTIVFVYMTGDIFFHCQVK